MTRSDNARLMSQIKSIARGNCYAWPGGYELHAITNDGAVLCHRCIESEYPRIAHETVKSGWEQCGFSVAGIDTNYEDDNMYCDHCNEQIVSEYGDES